MGFDALMAEVPRYTQMENLIYHLQRGASEVDLKNPKAEIKRIRNEVRSGLYEGSMRDAFSEIGTYLDELDTGCDTRHRGMLHAYHDYAQTGILAGLEAYLEGDAHAAQELLAESKEVERCVIEEYDRELVNGFVERLDYRAFVELSYVRASVLLEAIRDDTYTIVSDDISAIVTDYVADRGIDETTLRSIDKGRNLAVASRYGTRLEAYRELDALHRLGAAVPTRPRN